MSFRTYLGRKTEFFASAEEFNKWYDCYKPGSGKRLQYDAYEEDDASSCVRLSNEKGSKHQSTRGQIMFRRYKQSLENIISHWVSVFYEPKFMITLDSSKVSGIWYRQFAGIGCTKNGSLFHMAISQCNKIKSGSMHGSIPCIFGMKVLKNPFNIPFPQFEYSVDTCPFQRFIDDYCRHVRALLINLNAWKSRHHVDEIYLDLNDFGLDCKFPHTEVSPVSRVLELTESTEVKLMQMDVQHDNAVRKYIN